MAKPLPKSVLGCFTTLVQALGSVTAVLESSPEQLSITGNTARGSLRVVCSQKMTIVMYIRVGSNGRLELGNSGVYSTLRVNGALGNQGYQFTADPRGVTVPITSTLGVTGPVKAGDYSGQSVAILALP